MTIEKFGRNDIVINNAQASKSGLLLEEHTKEGIRGLSRVAATEWGEHGSGLRP